MFNLSIDLHIDAPNSNVLGIFLCDLLEFLGTRDIPVDCCIYNVEGLSDEKQESEG